jgi:hypothetical protein
MTLANFVLPGVSGECPASEFMIDFENPPPKRHFSQKFKPVGWAKSSLARSGGTSMGGKTG